MMVATRHGADSRSSCAARPRGRCRASKAPCPSWVEIRHGMSAAPTAWGRIIGRDAETVSPRDARDPASKLRLLSEVPPSIDYMIAPVDVERLAGNQLCSVHSEEGDRRADVIDRNKAAGRRLRMGLL